MRRAAFAIAAIAMTGCGGDDPEPAAPTPAPKKAAAPKETDELVSIGGGRKLHYRCTGTGSPTVIFEGGDGDDIAQYHTAESTLAETTKTCAYERAGLGGSTPARGPRQLDDLTADFAKLLSTAKIPGPYVLVGISGGGYISAAYAVDNPDKVAGLVLVDTAAPFVDPPPEIVEETAWDNPANVEQRDYLQVEKDAWKKRKRIGDMPVRIMSAKQEGADNVRQQRGWLVLSTNAAQVLADTGHSIDEEDPDLVDKTILEVVKEARR